MIKQDEIQFHMYIVSCVIKKNFVRILYEWTSLFGSMMSKYAESFQHENKGCNLIGIYKPCDNNCSKWYISDTGIIYDSQ
jgi:hypothetical protein